MFVTAAMEYIADGYTATECLHEKFLFLFFVGVRFSNRCRYFYYIRLIAKNIHSEKQMVTIQIALVFLLLYGIVVLKAVENIGHLSILSIMEPLRSIPFICRVHKVDKLRSKVS